MSQNEINNNETEEENTGSDSAFDDIDMNEETVDFSELEDTIDISALMEEKKEEEPREEPPATGTEKIKRGFRSIYDKFVKILMVPEDSDALLEDDEYEGDIFSDENETKKRSSVNRKKSASDPDNNSKTNDTSVKTAKTTSEDEPEKKQGFLSSAISSIFRDPEEDAVNDTEIIETEDEKADNINTESEPQKAENTDSVSVHTDKNIKPKKQAVPSGRKEEKRPGILTTASLYKAQESVQNKTEKKEFMDDDIAETETAAESMPVESERIAPTVNAREGLRSEITIEDIMRAKNSVPERSSKAYRTADVKKEEKHSVKPAAENRSDNKPVSPVKIESINNEQQKPHKPAAVSETERKPKPTNSEIHQVQQKPHKTAAVSETERKPKPTSSEIHQVQQKPNKSSVILIDESQKTKPAKEKINREYQKPSPAIAEVKKIQPKPQKTETADGMPGGDGIKIEPWTPERKKDTVVYRSAESNPFVVMAGKFTNTLKAEYENTIAIRNISVQSAEPVTPPPVQPVINVRQHEPVTVEKAKNKASNQSNTKHHTVRTAVPGSAENAKKENPKISDNHTKKKTENKAVNKTAKAAAQEKKKFHFKDIFDYEGDKFDEEEEEEVIKPEISDYNKAEDANEIKGDINENFGKVFLRTIILACTFILSAITAVVAKTMPWIFLNMLKNGWLVYSAVMFLLFLVSVYISRFPLFNGFSPLKKLKGNSDTPISVAALAVAIQSIVSLFQPNVFLDETYHIYVPLLILSLLLSSLGKLLIIRRTADNFRFLRSDRAKYAGKIYTNMQNAEKFVSGLASRRPIIAYTKYSKFMSNFLQLSYAADPVEELSGIFAPLTSALSLIASVAYGIISKDFVGGVSFFAVSTCITIPMCSLLAINIPMMKLCSGANRSGAMIVGYEAVKQFGDTNVIMFESSDLYPEGSIVLSGMKTLNESKLREAISAGASMTFAVNGPLTHVFETIVRQSKYDLPEYESVSYDDEMGLSGWCNGSRILIGTRELFKKHNIRLPDESIETRYRKRGNEIIYISVGGELAVMFILTYKTDKAIAQSLRELEESGVNFVVRTIDPIVNQKHIAEKFGLYPRCIKVLPANIGKICHDELSSKEKTSRAYLVTNGKLSAFAGAVAGCIRIKSTVTIAKIIQYLAIIIGFILVTVIAFVSGFAKLGSVELLFYTIFWCTALIIVSLAARKLS